MGAFTGFAVALLAAMAGLEGQKPANTTLVSPLSAAAALTLALNGAGARRCPRAPPPGGDWPAPPGRTPAHTAPPARPAHRVRPRPVPHPPAPTPPPPRRAPRRAQRDAHGAAARAVAERDRVRRRRRKGAQRRAQPPDGDAAERRRRRARAAGKRAVGARGRGPQGGLRQVHAAAVPGAPAPRTRPRARPCHNMPCRAAPAAAASSGGGGLRGSPGSGRPEAASRQGSARWQQGGARWQLGLARRRSGRMQGAPPEGRPFTPTCAHSLLPLALPSPRSPPLGDRQVGRHARRHQRVGQGRNAGADPQPGQPRRCLRRRPHQRPLLQGKVELPVPGSGHAGAPVHDAHRRQAPGAFRRGRGWTGFGGPGRRRPASGWSGARRAHTPLNTHP
jgi:hypothetical protein